MAKAVLLFMIISHDVNDFGAIVQYMQRFFMIIDEVTGGLYSLID